MSLNSAGSDDGSEPAVQHPMNPRVEAKIQGKHHSSEKVFDRGLIMANLSKIRMSLLEIEHEM